jgi:hypothetical protein
MVAVVVPLSERPELLDDEELSIRHLSHYLSAYDKYLIAPPGVSVRRDGFVTRHFPRTFFGSVAAHNSLLLWPAFYRAFSEYEFILVHHLDSLVLSNELLRWCRAGFDYIGAPWLPGPETPWVREPRVGNGGFTLMRVDAALEVLQERRRQEPLTRITDVLDRHATRLRPMYRALERVHRIMPGAALPARLLAHRDRVQSPSRHGLNNDYFWSFQATNYVPGFRVATPEAGLRFAFEMYPRRCFELNGGQLPFGCHAWAKFDPAFWEPYLLRNVPHAG